MFRKGYFTKMLSAFLAISMVFTMMGGISVPVFAAEPTESTVVTYPLQSCDQISEQLELSVNGESVPIVKFMSNYDYCHFSFDGTAEITITVKSGNVGTYSISPLAMEIVGAVDGNQLTFSIDQSRYLIVKIGALRDLVIAADDLETDVPDADAEGVFNITDQAYGADATGVALATEAIQKAIDDAAAYGTAEKPGIVYVPAGLFTFTSITLKSNVSLYLAGGAVLKASTDVSQYGAPMFHKDSVDMDGDWNITTEPGSENVKIYGRGTVDGSGMVLRYQKRRINHVIIPMQCSGFTMDGIVVRDGALWTVVPVRCDNVTITNTKHLNDVRDNTEDDAIDIVESQNVLVQHTIAISEDDTYSTKTWYEGTDIAPNWAGSPEPVEDVVFDDCFAFTRCGGFKIGWGCYQPQTNVTFKNSYVYRCMFAVLVTMNYGEVPVKNVTFENIDVEGFWPKDANKGRWLEFWISGGCSGVAEDILVKDINIRTANHIPSPLTGRSDTSGFNGVTLQNITMPGATEPAKTLKEMSITNTNSFVKDLKILTGEETGEIADYTAVHLRLNDVPTDLGGYTARSVQALNDAVAAIEYGLSDQAAVDKMAANLDAAIAGLKNNGIAVYEAEDAVLSGTAEVRTSADTKVSGGKFVGDIDNGRGFIDFTVNANKAGVQAMEIWAITLSSRDFQITVNDGAPQTVSCAGGGSWDSNPVLTTVNVKLKEGANTIRFGNTAGVTPSLDRITFALSAEEQAQAGAVDTLIGEIPALGDLTAEDTEEIAAAKEKIDAARAAYDALPTYLQDLVEYYDVLTDAEATIEALEKPVEPIDPDAADKEAAAQVDALIEAIGEITSIEQEASVQAARAAYDALTEKQKGFVTKEDELIAAEAALEILPKPVEYPDGDVDKSGVVDVADIMKLKALIMTEQWNEDELTLGDLSGNGALDVADIMGIKNIIMSE